MRVVYSRHARQRMKQRGITERDVEQCLSNYFQSTSNKEGKTTYLSHVAGRTLKVVVRPLHDSDDGTFVITTAWRDDDDS